MISPLRLFLRLSYGEQVATAAPLSFAQERLWFLEQLEPGSAVYNICRASRLTGQLNIAALEASLTEILRRHEILRSLIRVIDGRPMQITVVPPRFKLHFTDLRSLTRTELDDEIRRRIRAEAERQFDFSAGLFLRAVLLQISDDQHILDSHDPSYCLRCMVDGDSDARTLVTI